MADAHLSAEEAMHNFFPAAMYSNWIRMMQDTQVNYTIADVVPPMLFTPAVPGDPVWAAAFPLFTEYMNHYFGDLRIAQEHYHSIIQYNEFLAALLAQYGMAQYGGQFGDWVPPPPANKTSIAFTSA